MLIAFLAIVFFILLISGVLFEIIGGVFVVVFAVLGAVFEIIGGLLAALVGILLAGVMTIRDFLPKNLNSFGEIFSSKKVRRLNSGEYSIEIWNFLVEKTGSEEEATAWLDMHQEGYPGTVRQAVNRGYGRLVWLDLMNKEQSRGKSVNSRRRV